MDKHQIYELLAQKLGKQKVSSNPQQLSCYSADLWPRFLLSRLGGKPPPITPAVICWPETVDDVVKLVKLCNKHAIPIVPVGAGSGVCGAASPVSNCVMLDAKRLNRVIKLDENERTLIVEAGKNGLQLEEELQARGYTLGHYPSSIACSTVGGWVACRSAGQYSSKYGKIEDMVCGLEVVLSSGKLIRLGTLAGRTDHDWGLDLFVGSEGTLGFITKVAFRLWPAPERVEFAGFAFHDLKEGLRYMRLVMQRQLQPIVLRLYDPFDALVGGFHSTDTLPGLHYSDSSVSSRKVSRLLQALSGPLNVAGVRLLLMNTGLINRLSEILPVRPVLIIGFGGQVKECHDKWDVANRILNECRGGNLGPGPGWLWYRSRYSVSYKQSKIFSAGAFVDTMEVVTTWDAVYEIYRQVLKALSPYVFVMAHFSHAYPQGCSIYFTFAGYRPSIRASEKLYRKVWSIGLDTVSKYGGCISHHHGIGVLKKSFLDRETPGGRKLFQLLKQSLDPKWIFNPDKLYGSGPNYLKT